MNNLGKKRSSCLVVSAFSLQSLFGINTEPNEMPSDLRESEIAIWTEGIKSWRTPLTNIGASCADCHAPDAIDLAFINVNEADIRRRAIGDGLGEEDLENVLAFIDLQRERYQIDEPVDRFHFRPLQPGDGTIVPKGQPLPGDTVEERDHNFFKMVLKDRYPELVDSDYITTREQFLSLLDRFSKTDVRDVPIGLPLPLWVSDGFNGHDTHTRLQDEWVPSFAGVPNNELYYMYADQYISNPTRENLYEMLDAAKEMLDHQGFFGKDGSRVKAAEMERAKFFSMLLGQHIIRLKALGEDEKDFLEPNLAFREFFEYRTGNALSDHEYLSLDDRKAGLRGDAQNVPFIRELFSVVNHARKPHGDHYRENILVARGGKEKLFAEMKEKGFSADSDAGQLYMLGYPEAFCRQESFGPQPYGRQGGKRNSVMSTWFMLSTQLNENFRTGYALGSLNREENHFLRTWRGFIDSVRSWRYTDEAGEVATGGYIIPYGFSVHFPASLTKSPDWVSNIVVSQYDRDLVLTNVNASLFGLFAYAENLRNRTFHTKHFRAGGPAQVELSLLGQYHNVRLLAPELMSGVVDPLMDEIDAAIDALDSEYHRNNPWFAERKYFTGKQRKSFFNTTKQRINAFDSSEYDWATGDVELDRIVHRFLVYSEKILSSKHKLFKNPRSSRDLPRALINTLHFVKYKSDHEKSDYLILNVIEPALRQVEEQANLINPEYLEFNAWFVERRVPSRNELKYGRI